MQGFGGFPDKFELVRVPAPFFSDLLPIIDHLGEMKVTLYCFWALPRREGEYPYVTRQDFINDALFMAGMGTPAEAALDDALERAVARGTLLQAKTETGKALYFANTARGRAAIEAITRGTWRPGTDDSETEIALSVTRPNIFVLYEQNIGPLTPMIADALRDIEANFSAAWIEEAIQKAVLRNARNLAYFRAILQRWQSEGKKDGGRHQGDSEQTRREYFSGEYSDDIKR